MDIRLKKEGNLNRYGYRGKVYLRGASVTVDDSTGIYLKGTGRFEDTPDTQESSITFVGGKPKQATIEVPTFKSKKDAEEFTRTTFEVELDRRLTLKKLQGQVQMLADGAEWATLENAKPYVEGLDGDMKDDTPESVTI